jgi:hypothetical protein
MTDTYFLAPSLVAFRNSIDKAFPHRDKESDGWIGNAAHAARVSEHNPCWTCTGYQYGIVRATDTDIDDNDPGRDLRLEILNSTIGHPAVWYVISNGIIYSRTYGWKARKYNGTNGHFHHVHVSINKNEKSAKDTSLVLKSRSLPPKQPLPSGGGSAGSMDPLGNGDALLSLWCINYHLKAGPVSGECLGDVRRIMAVARIKGGAQDKQNEIDWYSARHSEALARARNDTAAVGAHLRHQAALFKSAIQTIQRVGHLTPDGVVGPLTQSFMRTFGYSFKTK